MVGYEALALMGVVVGLAIAVGCLVHGVLIGALGMAALVASGRDCDR